MGYFKDTLKGISWIGGLRGITRLITFIKLAILARILTPFDFGLFGIAALVLAFLEIITETGINIFMLQQKEKWEELVNTAWVVSIVRGVLMGLVILALTPFIAIFFKSQNVTNLLYLTSLIPVIRGFINPANIRFQKDLDFKKEFNFRLVLTLTEFSAASILAFILRSPESLIIAMIFSAIVEVVLSIVLIKPRPKFVYNSNEAREIIHQGKWITGYSVFSYILTQGDDIAVGKLLGASPLGIYQNAYKISTLPMLEAHDVILRVTFPIYSKLQEDPGRLKEAVKKQISFTLVFSVIIGLVLFLYSEEIVYIVLGPNWISSAPIVKVLAFLGSIRGISYSFNSLFLALKKQKYVTYITFVSVVGLLVTLIPLIKKYGMVGAAASEMFGSVITLPLAIYYMRKVFREL